MSDSDIRDGVAVEPWSGHVELGALHVESPSSSSMEMALDVC